MPYARHLTNKKETRPSPEKKLLIHISIAVTPEAGTKLALKRWEPNGIVGVAPFLSLFFTQPDRPLPNMSNFKSDVGITI